MTEHVHRWIIDDKPMDGYYPSVCGCGEMRAFKVESFDGFHLEDECTFEERNYEALVGGGRMSHNPHHLADEEV